MPNPTTTPTATPTATVPPDGYEPDDTPENAKVIACGESQERDIEPAGDEDWLEFTLAERQSLSIETFGMFGDTLLELFDSAQNPIGSDDDGGEGRFSRLADLELEAGVYLIRVQDFGSNDGIPAYGVRLECFPACERRGDGRVD